MSSHRTNTSVKFQYLWKPSHMYFLSPVKRTLKEPSFIFPKLYKKGITIGKPELLDSVKNFLSLLNITEENLLERDLSFFKHNNKERPEVVQTRFEHYESHWMIYLNQLYEMLELEKAKFQIWWSENGSLVPFKAMEENKIIIKLDPTPLNKSPVKASQEVPASNVTSPWVKKKATMISIDSPGKRAWNSS